MDATDWAGRLEQMEHWYRDLLASGAAESFLHNDYLPHVPFLASLTGRVVDVGGGAGVAGRYLSLACDHVVVDPAPVWQDAGWREFSSRFSGGRASEFVAGGGEALPFQNSEFDAGLALWSLNHAANPAVCVAELARVVRPSGKVLIVLEDMEPRWRDWAASLFRRIGYRFGRSRLDHGAFGALWPVLAGKLSSKPWPLQEYHCRILETELMEWADPYFCLLRREWLGGFLTLEFTRR